MDRRAFISLITASLSASLAAQPAQARRRIGILSGGTVPRSGLAEEMGKFGWVEGQNLVIERRGDDVIQLTSVAVEVGLLYV